MHHWQSSVELSHLVGSVALMFIESWNEEFQAHFVVGEHPPPVFVYDVARALIGNGVITAAWTTYEVGCASSEGIERPATWRSWLVLDQSSVAHFEVAFDAVFYDEYQERDRGSQPVPGSVTTCWQRSLADVVGYRITGFGPVAAEPKRWGALHGVELIFTNGQTIELPGELGLHGPDRRLANDFHAAVRQARPL
ncbi:hypothetical protein A9W96_22565 [Mycobacterium sp. 1245852.3]|nr:hypothetical protein A9W96_22565 [Mycobacterium sp. 1245852.3]